MLDSYYYAKNDYKIFENDILKSDKDYLNGYKVYWKDSKKKDKKAPLIVVNSFASRSYGFHFDDESSMMPRFFKEGIDVYIIEWGTDDVMSHTNGWKIYDYVEKVSNVVKATQDKYKVDKVNMFAVCAGVVFALAYLNECPNTVRKILFLDAPFFSTRDQGVQKSALYLNSLMEQYGLFYSLFNINEFPMGLITSMFLLPGISPTSLAFSTQQILKDTGYFSYLRLLMWGIDDRHIPLSLWKQILEDFNALNKDPDGDHLLSIKNILKIFKKNPDLRCYNLIGDDDMVVKPSASIISTNEEELIKWFDHQKIVNSGHFMYARKCNDEVEKVKDDIGKWFASNGK